MENTRLAFASAPDLLVFCQPDITTIDQPFRDIPGFSVERVCVTGSTNVLAHTSKGFIKKSPTPGRNNREVNLDWTVHSFHVLAAPRAHVIASIRTLLGPGTTDAPFMNTRQATRHSTNNSGVSLRRQSGGNLSRLNSTEKEDTAIISTKVQIRYTNSKLVVLEGGLKPSKVLQLHAQSASIHADRREQANRMLSISTEFTGEFEQVSLAVRVCAPRPNLRTAEAANSTAPRHESSSTGLRVIAAPSIVCKYRDVDCRADSSICDRQQVAGVTFPELALSWSLPAHVALLDLAREYRAAATTLMTRLSKTPTPPRSMSVTAVELDVGDVSSSDGNTLVKPPELVLNCEVEVGVVTITLAMPETRTIAKVPPVPKNSRKRCTGPTSPAPGTTEETVWNLLPLVLKVSRFEASAQFSKAHALDGHPAKMACQSASVMCATLVSKLHNKDIVTISATEVEYAKCQDRFPEVSQLAKRCARKPSGFQSSQPSTSQRLSKEEAGDWWWQSVDLADFNGASAWFVQIQGVECTHPYTKALNMGQYLEQMQNIVVAVKRIHFGLPQAGAGVVPAKHLPPVVMVRVNAVQISVEDDPFEIHIDQNYRLLKEELHERQQRKMLLDKKIEGIRRASASRGELDELWVASMYEALELKNGEIYVRRAKKLRKHVDDSPPLLVEIKATTCEFTFIPDRHLVNLDGVEAAIQTVNPEAMHSDTPSRATFTFARRVALSCDLLTVTMRTFSSPLLWANGLDVNGLLILQSRKQADYIEDLTARKVTMDGLSGPPIVRDGAPLKTYHALNVEVETLRHSWGPSVDPTIQQVMLIFELMLSRGKFTAAPTGIPMPWYDKLRQLRHGPLFVRCDNWTTSVMVSSDPHTNFDRVDLDVQQMVAKWQHGSLKLEGDIGVTVFPMTKFFACPILELPDVTITLDLTWICAQRDGKDCAVMHHLEDLSLFKSQSVNYDLRISMAKDAPGIHIRAHMLLGFHPTDVAS